MPKYIYKCSHCKEDFEIYHSMQETVGQCILCGSQAVQRIPSLCFTSSKATDAGKIVKSHIEEGRKSILEQKEKMREEYDG